MFKIDDGDWTRFRSLPGVQELDLHLSGCKGEPADWTPYYERMSDIYDSVLQTLRTLQSDESVLRLLIRHGRSTSRPGKTTSRSQVRKLMRSRDATPYIIRAQSIQHPSVFVAALRKIAK